MKNINSTIREQREAFKVIFVDEEEIDEEKDTKKTDKKIE